MPVQRHALILDHIRQRGAVSIQELASVIGSSISTIRRDLDRLEARGALARSRGGAILPSRPHATFEPAADLAAQLAHAEKRMIGAAAAEMLEPGESVIFDSSSTVMCAAQALVGRAVPLTAVTNDMGIAQVLAQAKSIHVMVSGGAVRYGSLSLTGHPGQDFLSGLHVDTLLLGTHTISGTIITDTSIEIAAMKQAMIRAARRVVLLADSSKPQRPAFCTICDMAEVDVLVTDDRTEKNVLDRIRERGVTVKVVATPHEALDP
jgi:DeoR family transcriptional regulator of aga operon